MTPLTRRDALSALALSAALPGALLAQGTAAGQPLTPVPTPEDLGKLPPDLANLHPLMEHIATGRRLRLSFLDDQWKDLDAWKREARVEYRRRLSYDPPVPGLRAELVRREDRGDFDLEILRLPVNPTYHLPLRLLVPKNRRGRLPAVVGLHDHSGRYVWGHEKIISSPSDAGELVSLRRDAYGGRPWAEDLARRGFVVAVIDGFYFGERRLRVEDLVASRVIPEAREAHSAARSAKPDTPEWHRATNRVCSLYEHLTAKNLTVAGATWPGLHVWDDMRTVDYLISRPEVDPQRLGCAGLSIGGLRSAHLAAADERIKAACVTGWMTQFARMHRNHLRNHTWMIYVPGLYDSMDFPDVAALHAPGALLVQQCRRDLLYPIEAMQGAVDRLTRIYRKAGVPERFRGTFYDEPHVFKPHMQEEAFAWFERWL